MCSFWEDDNFRDRGEFANSATDGCFSGVNHPEISDECQLYMIKHIASSSHICHFKIAQFARHNFRLHISFNIYIFLILNI